jgi:hypothetical protein
VKSQAMAKRSTVAICLLMVLFKMAEVENQHRLSE